MGVLRDQEERYLSRRFKVFRIGGRFLHVCTTSSLTYLNLTQRHFPLSIYKEIEMKEMDRLSSVIR